MCKFLSAIVFKDRVEFAPLDNQSHSHLLEKMGIADTRENALTKFVRVEITPPVGNAGASMRNWKYLVDQDIRPDWYNEDPDKYEQLVRAKAEEFILKHFARFAGHLWEVGHVDENGNTTYWMFDKWKEIGFDGKTNNYETSDLRKELNGSKLLKDLKDELGDRLLPISIDLLSLDGLSDYGIIKGDYLGIPNLDMYGRDRNNISKVNYCFWLSTPYSTPQGCSSDCVCGVGRDGGVRYDWCGYDGAVRLFLILSPSNL